MSARLGAIAGDVGRGLAAGLAGTGARLATVWTAEQVVLPATGIVFTWLDHQQ